MPSVDPSTPMRVTEVVIKGNHRTRRSVFDRELKQAYDATTLLDVLVGLEVATVGLRNTGAFKSVRIELDDAHGHASSSAGARAVIHVKEKRWYDLQFQTVIEGQRPRSQLNASLINVLGGTEVISISRGRHKSGSLFGGAMGAALPKAPTAALGGKVKDMCIVCIYVNAIEC